jgi:hypothetical protein
MRTVMEKIIEILKNNLFRILYLILLIALLVFMVHKSKTTEDDSKNVINGEQLVDENEY